MRKGIPIILVCSALLLTAGIAQTRSTSGHVAAAIVNCRCGKPGCPRCFPCKQKRCRCRKCPKCQTDVCYLEAECVKEERKSFEVEQKVICIPPVSLPFLRKCKQPCDGSCGGRCRKHCAKTKVVKVLKTTTYECPKCKYTWKLCEPPLPERSPYNQVEPPEPQLPDPEVAQPEFEPNELYDPSGSDVPQAPTPLNSDSGN